MASQNNVLTNALRTRMAQLLAGKLSTVPKVKYLAVGSGGLDTSGNPTAPSGAETALQKEEGRYEVEDPTFPVDTTVRFAAVIPMADLAGKKLSEVGLFSEDNVLYAIRHMLPKQKDSDEEMEFTHDLEF
ncbi:MULTISPECIES: phage tail-collar fiber domain-containing protein [Caproicibacterium]|uniref:Phage tail protein n=1 Tax=Caproicibacterium argilliputei TaxID=3030016 RepID=A0AA97DCJ0_9FIRM|nr:phage tail protein [Caproicibacterium argilliputei]WOC33068.1 phage tail protein [Caproicibacterium argilliputei]